MKIIPVYLEIGATTYKTRALAKGYYSVWECVNIHSLKYLGEWTKPQLIKSCKRGELN